MKKSNRERIEELKQLYKQEFLKQKQILDKIKRKTYLQKIEYALNKLEGLKEKLNEPDYWIEQLNQKSSTAEAMLNMALEQNDHPSPPENLLGSAEENTQSTSKTLDNTISTENKSSSSPPISDSTPTKSLDDLEL